MRLNLEGIANREAWVEAGFIMPGFDVAAVREKTRVAPAWVHFGAGNIFRAFPAERQQRILDSGLTDVGIIVAEGWDFDIVDAAFRPFDDLCISVVLLPDGGATKTVVASIVESLKADPACADFERLKQVFRAPTLAMVTFSITEKGYLLDRCGAIAPEVAADFRAGPAAPASFMGRLASLLHERFRAGAKPIALVSMDNCSHNGDKLRDAVLPFAREWSGSGLVDAAFLDYVSDPASVSFPWTMIDKITPRPFDGVRDGLAKDGVEGLEIVVTKKDTYVAGFVNAEEAAYLVVEDAFPNGRPPLEKAGVIFADRETVDKAEKMKVGSCLNPLHTALGIFANPLAYVAVSDAMEDKDLRRLMERIGYDEGLPVAADPGIINPRAFLEEVIDRRFSNPHVPDTVQRLAVDVSQALPVRFGGTIQAYAADPGRGTGKLVFIPLTLAGWLRYLLGVDDFGGRYELSPDPMAAEAVKRLQGVGLGAAGPFHDLLKPLLSDACLFGVDLYSVGLGERVEGYFAELIAGPGAVRRTLEKYLG